MKKLFLLLFSVLAITSQVRAGVYVAYKPTKPVAISWDNGTWSGEQLDTKDIATFYTLSKNDVINIRITNVGTGMGYELDYKEGDKWTWTKLENNVSYNNDGVISYTVESNEIANYIKERGLIIKGIYFKVLDITVTTSSIDSDIHDGDYTYQTLSNTSTDLGSGWETFVDLRYCGYQNLRKGDILNITYTVYNSNAGTIQLQHNWSKYSDATTFTELTAGSSNETLKITIDDEMLSKFKVEGDDRNSAFVIKGAYVTINSVKLTTKLAGYRPVYIPASKYATFFGASTCALPVGVEAYYVSSTTNGSATLTGLSNIPANQGVILKGEEEGIYQLYTTTDAAASVVDNKLVGSTSRQQITDASGKYILYNNAGNPEFRTITAGTYLDAFKCYLNAPGVTPSKLNIVFAEDEEQQGETNSIRNIANTNVNNNVVYNMNGQRVGSDYKGLVIVNGKKIIRK